MWGRLTAGGWLRLHQLHPSCLITNPVVRLVHKMCKVIDDFWEPKRRKKEKRVGQISSFVLFYAAIVTPSATIKTYYFFCLRFNYIKDLPVSLVNKKKLPEMQKLKSSAGLDIRLPPQRPEWWWWGCWWREWAVWKHSSHFQMVSLLPESILDLIKSLLFMSFKDVSPGFRDYAWASKERECVFCVCVCMFGSVARVL